MPSQKITGLIFQNLPLLFRDAPPVKTNSSHLQIVVCKIKAGSNLYLTEMWIMYNVEQA